MESRAPSTKGRPATTVFAGFQPQPIAPPYEPPQRRLWPLTAAIIILAAIALMGVGGVIAIALIHDYSGGRVDLPNNQQLSALTTPTPYAKSVQSPPVSVATTQQTTPRPTPVPQPTATPTVERKVEQPNVPPAYVPPTPAPTIEVPRLGQPTVVINWSNTLKDGAWIAWNVQPGYYLLNVTSQPDGASAEWSGTESCDFKTRELTLLNQRCKMITAGHLVISNPTRFGLGAACLVTVRLTRF